MLDRFLRTLQCLIHGVDVGMDLLKALDLEPDGSWMGQPMVSAMAPWGMQVWSFLHYFFLMNFGCLFFVCDLFILIHVLSFSLYFNLFFSFVCVWHDCFLVFFFQIWIVISVIVSLLHNRFFNVYSGSKNTTEFIDCKVLEYSLYIFLHIKSC